MIIKAIKKPETIEALQWTGENAEEVTSFLKQGDFSVAGYVKGGYVDIGTPKGLLVASKGDYIIKDIKGELDLCKPDIFPDIFEATYQSGGRMISIAKLINTQVFLFGIALGYFVSCIF